MKIRYLLSVLFVLLAAEYPTATLAGTQAEYKALQTYCTGMGKWRAGGRQGTPPATQGLTDIDRFQPYCDALANMGRLYLPRNQMEKQVILAGIQNGLEFVISQVPGNHYLLPEVYAQLGKALYLANDYPSAETHLLKALSLDPLHAPVYATLAELYRDTKRKDKAAAAVRAGLALSPEMHSLKRIARELGIAVKQAKPAAETVKSGVTATSPAKEKGVEGKVDEPQTSASQDAATPPGNPVEVGHPGNPWCRFCPENQAAPAAPSPSTPGVIPKDWR